MVKKYLHYSDADISVNKKMKKREDEEMKLAGGEGDEQDFASEDKQLAKLLEQTKKRKLELKEEISKKKKKSKPKTKVKSEEE